MARPGALEHGQDIVHPHWLAWPGLPGLPALTAPLLTGLPRLPTALRSKSSALQARPNLASPRRQIQSGALFVRLQTSPLSGRLSELPRPQRTRRYKYLLGTWLLDKESFAVILPSLALDDKGQNQTIAI
jgi:hypothetical protein